MNNTKIIVFSNQKGGVGKTTCTRELGIYLAGVGHKVLLIDADPQANLSKSLTDDPGSGLYDALCDASHGEPRGPDIEPMEVKPCLYLLSGGLKLAGLDKSLIGELDAYTRLRELLEKEEFQIYDFILIDSPPSLGVLTVNALTASNYLIVPMNPSLYSMQGTNDLIGTMVKVKKNLNPALSLLGVIINAFDSVPTITKQIRAEIEETFREKVFKAVLSKSIKVEEAIAAKSGVTVRKTKIGGEVKALGRELLSRIEGR